MQVDKREVVKLLRSRGEHDKAATAGCALPRQVDTEADVGVLRTFDVSVHELTEERPDRESPDT